MTAKAGPKELKQEISARLLEAGGKAEPVSLTATLDMWQRYFAGDSPFRSKKSRQDLPDGLVFAAALEVAARLAAGERLHVITADKQLRSACPPNVVSHEKLGDFLLCEDVVDALRAHAEETGEDVPTDQADALTGKVRESIGNDHATLRTAVEESLLRLVPGAKVTSAWFPSDNNDGTVDGVGGVEDLTLDLKKLEYLSRTDWTVPFSATLGDSLVTLYVHKSEVVNIEEGDRAGLSMSITDPDWNDSHVQVEATVSLRVKGVLRLEFEEDEYETVRLVGAEVDDLNDLAVIDP